MKSANVILFEDEPFFINAVGEALAASPHELIAVGNELGAAHRIIKTVERGIITPDVVILDANLSDEPERYGSDGRELFRYMGSVGMFNREGTEGVKIINFSRTSWWELEIRAHRDPGKFDPSRLPLVIDSIDPQEGWMRRIY